MRKIGLFLTIGAFFYGSINAQNRIAKPVESTVNVFKSQKGTVINYNPNLNLRINEKSTNATYYDSINHARTSFAWIYDNYGSVLTLNSPILFPDTNARMLDTIMINGIATEVKTSPFSIMGIGAVMDPTSDLLYPEQRFQGVDYTIKTIKINAWYDRVSNVTDTLFIDLVWGPHVWYDKDTHNISAWPFAYYLSTSKDYHYALPLINQGRLYSGNSTRIKRYYYPLTNSDTTLHDASIVESNVINMNINQLIPKDNIAGVMIYYKPGKAYDTNDVVFTNPGVDPIKKTLNSFRPIIFVENTDPIQELFLDPSSYALSYIIFDSQWKSSMLDPTGLYFPSSGTFYGNDITFVISGNFNVGTDEVRSLEGLTLGQNVPNPARDNTKIEYTLKNSANVTIDVYDITGKKVMSMVEGKKSAGTHNAVINTSKIDNGVYYYTLTADNVKLSKKMTVIK